MTKVFGVTLVIALITPTVHAEAVKAARASKAAAAEKYADTRIEKRLLLSAACSEYLIEEVSDLCQKKSSELLSEDVARLREAVKSHEARAAESATGAEEQMVAQKAVAVNVSSGNGVQQSSSTTSNVISGAMDCVQQATANIAKFTSSFNQRMAGRFANKK